MARTKKTLEERWKAIRDEEAARKFKAKRRYKTAWENAKNRRKWRAAEAATAADYHSVLESAIEARRLFELKYGGTGLVKHVSPERIRRELPKLKKRKLVARVSRRLNKDAAKKAAMKESTT